MPRANRDQCHLVLARFQVRKIIEVGEGNSHRPSAKVNGKRNATKAKRINDMT